MCLVRGFLTAVVGAAILVGSAGARADERRLTLQDAVQMAVSADEPALASLHARAQALEDEAIADAQLPDPRFTGVLANVPTDSFRLDQENMTQLKLGLRQEFPAGKTLQFRGRQRRAEAEAERGRRRLELRRIALDTRTAWLDLFFHRRAEQILKSNSQAVRNQIDSLAARFATGRMHAQGILRAELELSLIDDRLTEHRRQAETAQADLARYIGAAAVRPLPEHLPSMPRPQPLDALRSRLVDHPSVQVENAQIFAADAGIKLAEQAYKPSFALEGSYGLRTDRSDLASIGLTLSMPIFTDKRQDRRRAAAVRQRSSEQLSRDALLLDLKRQLEQAWADWQRLNERAALYGQAINARAAQTTEATLTTYANNQTDFAELIRSQLAELDVELERAELETRAAKAWAQIAYLTGEFL